MCAQTPECSHRGAYSYMWPTVTNRFPLRAKSLHSTLYTVRVQVSDWTELKDVVLLRILRRELKDVFKEVHRPHDVFILHTKRETVRTGSSGGRRRRRRRTVRLTFWQQSMNSSMVTTPSLFLSIFCRRQRERGEDRHEDRKAGFLTPDGCGTLA